MAKRETDFAAMAQAMQGLAQALVVSSERAAAQKQEIIAIMNAPQVLHVERDEETGRLCGAYITRGE